STACAFDPITLLVSGRRILQRSNSLSTPPFSSFIRQWRTLRSGTSRHPHHPLNSLIIKEFYLETAPEEVRIIGMPKLPSTLI
ncbi:hypothetical protein, partial [Pseudomonas sp. BN417]|uniref:hypothetical protein n=1 Tax=Pseudomonas sp. BN417 TaxID=2567890 RepID=UPI0024580521